MIHLDLEQNNILLTEFVRISVDWAHPNKKFTQKTSLPLIERHPLAFWKSLAAVLLISNIVLASLFI